MRQGSSVRDPLLKCVRQFPPSFCSFHHQQQMTKRQHAMQSLRPLAPLFLM